MADYSLQNLFSPRSKRVVVTGGGSGLGAFLASGLSANGADVWIVGRRKEKLDEVVEATKKHDGKVTPIVGDINTKDGITAIVEAYKSSGQTQLDVLINCAGILRSFKHNPEDADSLAEALWNDKWDDWSDSFNTNVTAAYFCSIAFIPLLRRDSKPNDASASPLIINVSSIAGLHHARGMAPSYQISKAAEHQLTSVLAAKLIPFSIRVTCLAPGIFPSEMTSGTGMLTESHLKKGIPEGRAGTGEDIVGTVIWMIGRSGAYLNGESVVLDGGRLLTVSAALGGHI